MSLVNYEGDTSEEEDNNNSGNVIQPTARRLHLPAPSHPPSNAVIDGDDDDDDYHPKEANSSSSTLLANLPKPQDSSTNNTNMNSTEIPENDLEEIVRGENKEYARNIPQLPKPVKRKRDGPVKIFIPTVAEVRLDFHFLLLISPCPFSS